MQTFSVFSKSPASRRLALLNSSILPYSRPVSKHTATMSTSSFPPQELREIVKEVATLLKDRKETISVAETVRPYTNPPALTMADD